MRKVILFKLVSPLKYRLLQTLVQCSLNCGNSQWLEEIEHIENSLKWKNVE